jgi:hypothetical protein
MYGAMEVDLRSFLTPALDRGNSLCYLRWNKVREPVEKFGENRTPSPSYPAQRLIIILTDKRRFDDAKSKVCLWFI